MTDSHGSAAASQITPNRKRLFIWRILIFVLPVLVIGAAVGANLILGALKPEPEEKENTIKAIPVLTAVATQDTVTLTVPAQGEVQPRNEINITPQVSGRLVYVSPNFIEGGKFKKGDLLARIEPAEYKLRVIQARANVIQAETTLTREKSESALARSDWAELGSLTAATPLTLREPQMAQAAAQLEASKAQLAEAELMHARTSIYAPFTGRVTTRDMDQGEFVSAGMKLGDVYGTDIMDVRLPLTHDDLRKAGLSLGFEASTETPGINVTLSASVAGRYSEWAGKIVRTDSRFDNTTRVLYAYVEVRDPFGAGSDNGTPLAPGLFVNAKIDGQVLEGIIVIPRPALRGENQVYVANSDNTLSIKTVAVLSSNRDTAILERESLDIGANVITSPIRGVADGMKIETVDKTLSEKDGDETASNTGDAP
ncbi:MAG: efflux RND transporter periplasmic adaptor subunit [Maricaulaceae bacterium]